jgi:hypothetical protein
MFCWCTRLWKPRCECPRARPEKLRVVILKIHLPTLQRVFNDERTKPRRATFTMATLQPIPRLLLPRGSLVLRPATRALLPLPYIATLRYASSSSNAKTLSEQFQRRQRQQQTAPIIPQPDKYRPPSHGKRTPRSETNYRTYGPALTEEDKKRMQTKKYPNMMSPEGSFSHWFLNNRVIHLWISMVGFLDPPRAPLGPFTPS